MVLFILFYLVEATFRKYLVPSPIVILVKYAPLYWFLLRSVPRKAVYYVYILFGIPLIATIASVTNIPFAIFDFNSTILIPLICFLVIPAITLSRPASLRILYLCIVGGGFNSLLIVIQAIAGPAHWISQTVDQNFSQHVFGWGGVLQKAPGIASQSTPFINVAGLLAIACLSRRGFLNSTTEKLLITLFIFSAIFNLQSRFYAFGLLMFLLVKYLYALCIRQKRIRTILTICAMLGLIVIAYFFISSYFPLLIDNNRTTNDVDSVVRRFSSFFPYEQSYLSLPLLGGLGLGATVNNNPYTFLELLPPQCVGIFIEWEFTRLVCAFGWYGYVIVFTRLFAAFAMLIRALFRGVKSANLFLESSGYIYVSIFVIFLGAQFKTNDIAAGLLLIATAARASVFCPHATPDLSGYPPNPIRI